MQQDKYDVLIIGAGAAGLMAAWELVQVDKKVAIIEARDRVGGRIHTLEEEGFSMPIELGAEFVHGKLKVTQWLLEKGGIRQYNVNGEIWRKEAKGLDKEGDFIDDYSLLDKKFKSLKKDIPVADFLDTYLPDPEHEEVRTSLKTYVEGYYAADTTKASTYALWEELQTADKEQYRVEGGYKRLIEFLLEELKKKNCAIFLSSPAQNIGWQADNVTVYTTKDKFHASKVLITLPLGVLQAGTLSFSPSIPDKMTAARSLGFGSAIKVIIQFTNAFWKQKEYTDGKDLSKAGFIFSEEAVPTWWTKYPKEAPVLVGWLGGPNADKFKYNSEEDILQKALESLGNIFSVSLQDLKQSVVKTAVANWAKDPYCCGGYSFDVVAGDQQKRILKEPVESTLFFAGEALYEGVEVGTVEAALVNGREIAHQLIASF